MPAPPRYLGRLRSVQGRLEDSEVVDMAKSCKAIEVPPEIVWKPKKGGLKSWAMVIGISIAVVLMMTLDNNSPGPITAAQTPLSFLCLSVTPVILAFVLFALFAMRSSSAWKSADPPLSGETVLKLSEQGFVVEKQTRDGRPLEMICSWQNATVSEGPDAWLFTWLVAAAPIHPILIAKRWIDDAEDLSIFEAFVHDVAKWRASQPPQSAKDDNAPDPFQAIPEDAIRFRCEAKIERIARREIAKPLVRDLPEYRSMPIVWNELAIVVVTCTLAVLLITVASLMFYLSSLLADDLPLSAMSIGVIFVPLGIIGSIVWFLRQLFIPNHTVYGGVSESEIWVDLGTVLRREPLSPFTFRRRIDDKLILGTPNGRSVIVLPRAFFESDEDFERVGNRMIEDFE